jgi:hypothetical protein
LLVQRLSLSDSARTPGLAELACQDMCNQEYDDFDGSDVSICIRTLPRAEGLDAILIERRPALQISTSLRSPITESPAFPRFHDRPSPAPTTGKANRLPKGTLRRAESP